MQGSGRPDYLSCYRALGLKAGCEWEEARRHYKLLSQKWHPDRHHHDSEARRRAEKKQRAINEAMQIISEYYKMHGHMPLTARPRVVLAQPTTSECEIEKDFSGEKTFGKKGPGTGSFVISVLLVTSVIWFLWSVLEDPVSTVAGNDPVVTQMQTGTDGWKEQERMQTEISGVDNTPLRRMPAPASGDNEVIRIGSTPEDVLRIQGEPLFKNPARWDYGPSHIEFRYNRVSGWHSSPMRPLRVEE